MDEKKKMPTMKRKRNYVSAAMGMLGASVVGLLCLSSSGFLQIRSDRERPTVTAGSERLVNNSVNEVQGEKMTRQKRILRFNRNVDRARNFGINVEFQQHDPIPLDESPYGNSDHRRLSVVLPNGDCEITWPEKPSKPIQTTYAASYPGCGARMSWNLIEALTGLWTGDDWNSNSRGKDVVTVKTHYPHTAGKLVDWDKEITRALIIIRNPMNAIPSFFNHIYEIKNHLPVHSERAPVAAWLEWRDRLLTGQIKAYAEFIRYWMQRFDEDHRIVLSYEALIDDHAGGAEAQRLAEFLSRADGVDPIQQDAVPCVWHKVVKYKEHADTGAQDNGMDGGAGENLDQSMVMQMQARRLEELTLSDIDLDEAALLTRGRRRLDPAHHDSQRSGPTERPYTPEQLNDMSIMLQELSSEFQDHAHLHGLLTRYEAEVRQSLSGDSGQHPVQNPLQLPSNSDSPDNNDQQISPDSNSDESDGQELPIDSNSHVVNEQQQSLDSSSNLNDGQQPPAVSNSFEDNGLQPPPMSNSFEENGQQQPFDSNSYDNSGQQQLPNSDSFQENGQQQSLDSIAYGDNEQQQDQIDNGDQTNNYPQQELPQEQFVDLGPNVPPPATTSDGRTFHIFQASPPNTGSVVVTNWLMGLFEPDAEYVYMANSPDLPLRQHGKPVPLTATTVTKTHVLELIELYKLFKPQFDEVFFVVSNRGKNPIRRVDNELCEFDNVLCLEYEELMYKNDAGLQKMVHTLTDKFQKRFAYFFGQFGGTVRMDEYSAVLRLKAMDATTKALEYQKIEVSDVKYGIHGHHRNRDSAEKKFFQTSNPFVGAGTIDEEANGVVDGEGNNENSDPQAYNDQVEDVVGAETMDLPTMNMDSMDTDLNGNDYQDYGGNGEDTPIVDGDDGPGAGRITVDPNLPRRLFYCGSTGPKENRRDSIYGIFLINSFFPEIEGGAPENEAGRENAIKLTRQSMKEATPNDFLVYHMHQYCETNVLKFPGLQLQVNAEYYDMHPDNRLNIDGKFTLRYVPPHENIYVIGPHKEGPRSIRLPYAMMKWWVLVKGCRAEPNYGIIEKFFDHSEKPKNTGKHFLLYANSHYVEYREKTASELSKIGPIHVIGKCQGNVDAGPIIEGTKPPQCRPFDDGKRPSNVKVPKSEDRGNRGFNRIFFQNYRFVLLMENTNISGYITEKIVDGFMSGAIPIYYGTPEVFDIFNEKAFIYFDIEKPKEALDRIAYLESNRDAYEQMLNEPILADGQNTIEKYFSFEDEIGNGMLKRRVREKLGFPV